MTRTKHMMIKINTPALAFTCILIIVFCIAAGSCSEGAIPRPYGYFRVDLPEHNYVRSHINDFPYSFDVSTVATSDIKNTEGEKYWMDIHYSMLNATIYCSYKTIHSDLFQLMEDTRNIVYKHSVRADAIAEIPYENKDKNVYGILYELTGNTASPAQFILTDSVRHFFRGALYFENVPNKDSIAPMVNYLQQDIVQLMESFAWK